MRLVSGTLLMSLVLTAPAPSQIASYTHFGNGCAGSLGIPKLDAAAGSMPILGEALSAELSFVPDNALAVGIIGLSSASFGNLTLPLDLTSAGMPNCFLYTNVRWTTALLVAGNTANWNVTVPNDSSWLGRSFFQQVFVLDPGLPGIGANLSDAVEAVIGLMPSDQRLDTTPPGEDLSGDPQIASSGDAVYVAWQDGRSNTGRDIYFNRSLDGGATWLSSDIRLNRDRLGMASPVPPEIAASGNSVYVAWKDQRNGQVGDIYFNRSLDGGTTWLIDDVRLDTDFPGSSGSGGPRIAVSGESVYVAWTDSRNDSVWAMNRADVYFNRSLDGGATWLTSDIRLPTDTPGASGSGSPEIVASGASIYVTWTDNRNGNSKRDVYLNRSLDGGVTWLTDDLRVNRDVPGENSSSGPQIAIAGESIYVTWTDQRNDDFDIYFNRSLDGGTTWLSDDLRLDTELPGVAWSFSPRIAVSGEHVYVTWRDQRDDASKHSIYFNRSLDGGVTWLSSDLRVDTGLPFADFLNPRIVAAGESVFVTWSSGRHVYLNRSLNSGAAWLTSSIRLDTDQPGSSRSEFPQIATSGGFVYVTWADRRNDIGFGWHDVYFNRLRVR